MGDIVDGMFQDGLLDWYDEDDEEAEYGGALRPLLRCRTCGSTDVRWRQQSGKWVLFSLTPGVEHRCDTTNDFTPEPTK